MFVNVGKKQLMGECMRIMENNVGSWENYFFFLIFSPLN